MSVVICEQIVWVIVKMLAKRPSGNTTLGTHFTKQQKLIIYFIGAFFFYKQFCKMQEYNNSKILTDNCTLDKRDLN